MAGEGLVIWLHGRGGSGEEYHPIPRFYFADPELAGLKWSFPTAPLRPISFLGGTRMNAWFDALEVPVSSRSLKDEEGVLKSVHDVHAIIEKEIQDGALAIASVLLCHEALGGVVVFGGYIPFNKSIEQQVPDKARKTPALWIHGSADATVLPDAGTAGVQFLQHLGMNIELKVIPGLGHSISDEALSYAASWLKAHVTKP